MTGPAAVSAPPGERPASEAWRRLVGRFGLDESTASTETAVKAVAFAVFARPPAVREPSDLLDALTLMGDYRAEVDDIEASLIRAAYAAGWSWQQIGEALGFPPRAARQSGRKRAVSLGVTVEPRHPRRARRSA